MQKKTAKYLRNSMCIWFNERKKDEPISFILVFKRSKAKAPNKSVQLMLMSSLFIFTNVCVCSASARAHARLPLEEVVISYYMIYIYMNVCVSL